MSYSLGVGTQRARSSEPQVGAEKPEGGRLQVDSLFAVGWWFVGGVVVMLLWRLLMTESMWVVVAAVPLLLLLLLTESMWVAMERPDIADNAAKPTARGHSHPLQKDGEH